MSVRAGRCKHFTGTAHKRCEAGVDYKSVRDTTVNPYRLACFEADLSCDKREYPSEEEIAAAEARRQHVLDCIQRGLSPCCEAPLDNREVLTSGEFKGHGPRFCSKCGKLVFMV